MVKRVIPREQSADVELSLPTRGRYRVQCMDSSGSPLPLQEGPVLNVVDSSLLAVSSVSPSMTTVDQEVQVRYLRKKKKIIIHYVICFSVKSRGTWSCTWTATALCTVVSESWHVSVDGTSYRYHGRRGCMCTYGNSNSRSSVASCCCLRTGSSQQV